MINFDFILKEKRKIFLVIALIFLLEAISFLSYFFPLINIIIFLSIAGLMLFLAIYKLEWSFYLVVTELFFNSVIFLESPIIIL